MHQLGIDISKATFDASLLINGKHKNKKFDNNPEGFLALAQWLDAYWPTELHVCMEGTGRLWEPLAEFLYERNVAVSVVNPLKIKGFARSELRRSKTDKLDAETIARFCRSNVPAVWKAPKSELKEIRDIQRMVDSLKKCTTQEKNRLKSGVLSTVVKRELEDHISYLENRICKLDALLQDLVKADEELTRKYDLLVSIVGVGPTTAITFLAELADIDNFPSAKEVEVFCGIAPRLYQSGSSVKAKTRISKMGNRRIRGSLYMPAMAAMRSNPFLKKFAERLKAAGKPGRVIICAVMRKLLRLMYAIVKSGQPFDRNYVSTAPHAAS